MRPFKTIAYLLIFILFSNCQKDDYTAHEDQLIDGSRFKVSHINKEIVQNNTDVFNKLNIMNSTLKGQRPSGLSREVYNEEYGFTIETEFVKYVEDTETGYHSYSFPLKRENPEDDKLENLVFQSNDKGTYDVYIIKYGFTKDEYEVLNIDQLENLSTKYTAIVFDELDFVSEENERVHYTCVEVWTEIDYTDHSGQLHGATNADGTCNVSGCNIGTTEWVLTGHECTVVGGGGNDNGGVNDDGTTNGPTNGPHGNGVIVPQYPIVGAPTVLEPWQEVFKCINSISEAGTTDETLLTTEMTDWLEGQPRNVVGSINNFLEDNACSEEAQNFILEVINTMIANPNDSFDDAVWENAILFPDTIASDIITDIDQYMDCFDLNQPAELTIYIDQPKANSDEPYRITFNPFDPVDVGHTFIAIKQGTITRVLGYYPIPNTINPSNNPNENIISCASIIRNDSGHDFDVSISTNITSIQLTNIYNIITNSNPTYNLNTYNCTDFGIEIGNQSSLTIPDTNGTWPRGGNGSNPGNLGQDIRGMTTPSGSTKDISGGSSISNSGSC